MILLFFAKSSKLIQRILVKEADLEKAVIGMALAAPFEIFKIDDG